MPRFDIRRAKGFLLLGLMAGLLAACGDGDTESVSFVKSATAVLAFNNTTQATSTQLTGEVDPLLSAAPSVLGIKLIAVYVAEDIDPATGNNIGQTSAFYFNPECNEDIRGCDVYGSAPNIVTSYFDLARPSDAVNAELNAQARGIAPATYRYARMEFSKDGGGQGPLDTPNVKYQGGSMTSPVEFIWGTGGTHTALMTEPITVFNGDSVTVTLDYDISMAFHDNPDPGFFFDHCDASNNCLTMPTFTPRPSKN